MYIPLGHYSIVFLFKHFISEHIFVYQASTPVSKYLFKVSKITLEQRPDGRCSNVILLTLNMYLPTGE